MCINMMSQQQQEDEMLARVTGLVFKEAPIQVGLAVFNATQKGVGLPATCQCLNAGNRPGSRVPLIH